jgi:hypothetical protein
MFIFFKMLYSLAVLFAQNKFRLIEILRLKSGQVSEWNAIIICWKYYSNSDFVEEPTFNSQILIGFLT